MAQKLIQNPRLLGPVHSLLYAWPRLLLGTRHSRLQRLELGCSALPSGGAPLSNGQSSAAEQEDGLEDLDDLVELEGLDGTQDHFKELQERAAELARACAEKDETLGKLNEYAEMDAGEARLKLQEQLRAAPVLEQK